MFAGLASPVSIRVDSSAQWRAQNERRVPRCRLEWRVLLEQLDLIDVSWHVSQSLVELPGAVVWSEDLDS
jgi:hypothetical protein